MLNLILFGPPGSGKGTQATKLADKFGLIHISTGDLFRYEIGNNTPLGIEAKRYMDQGQLCPDTVTIGMLRAKVERHPEAGGFIFDGFPRTVAQAQALDRLLKGMDEQVNLLIALDVAEDEITSRLLERGKTSGRADDQNEEVIRKRFSVYQAETAPVFDHYSGLNKARRVDGIGGIEEIFSRLTAEIEPHKDFR